MFLQNSSGLTDQEILESFELEKFVDFSIESDNYSEGDEEIAIEEKYLTAFESTFMEVQIKFKSPNSISEQASSPDSLIVTVRDGKLFIDERNRMMVPDGTDDSIDLPPQRTES